MTRPGHRPPRVRPARLVVGLFVELALWWGGAEVLQWRASRRPPGAAARPDGSLGLLVLGYPPEPSGEPSAEQKWRCDILMRTIAAHRGPVRVVFSGGRTTGAELSEAASLARYAVDVLGLDPSVVELEESATTTAQNVQLGLPLLAGCDRIAIVSNALHADRGRHEVEVLAPEAVPLLVLADDYRFGERPWHKARFTWHEALVGVWYWWYDRHPAMTPVQVSGSVAL